MQKLEKINHITFNYLQFILEDLGLDSDRRNFKEIHEMLYKNVVLSSKEFAHESFYVVCVAGFKQQYAKAMCNKIIKLIDERQGKVEIEDLFQIYRNKMKIKAIKYIWDNRDKLQETFYSLSNIDKKIEFLGTIPHIGNITKYHLARNLGLDFVKYDIWIQRLGIALYGTEDYVKQVNNSKLLKEIKYFCDKMFEDIREETNEKIGFIDVVLWRSCQQGLLKINGMDVFLDKKFKEKKK